MIDEMEHAADVHLGQDIEEGMIDGLTAAGIAQGPTDLPAASCDLEVLVLARGDALIHLGETGFQTRCELSQMLPDRLLQARQAHVRHARALLPPSLVVHQVILETPEAYAITTEDIAGFEPVA